MNVIINDIDDKDEILKLFKQIEDEVNEKIEEVGFDTDYTESSIWPVNKDGKPIYDFYERVIKFGEEKRVFDLVDNLIPFYGNYWKNSENTMGLDAATALAMHDKKYIKTFKNYLDSTDLDHQADVQYYIIDVTNAHEWDKETISLFVYYMYKIEELSYNFPTNSMVKYLKENEKNIELFKKIMVDVKDKLLEKSPNKEYFMDDYNENHANWIEKLEDSLLPSADDFLKIDVVGKKIFLDENPPVPMDLIKDVLIKNGATIDETITEDTDIVVSDDLNKAEKNCSYNNLIEVSAYKLLKEDFLEDVKWHIRDYELDELLQKLKSFKSLIKYTNLDSLFLYSHRLNLEFIKNLLSIDEAVLRIKEIASKQYRILSWLIEKFENPEVLKILELMAEKNLLSFAIDREIRESDGINYYPPIFDIIKSIKKDSSSEEIELAKQKIDYLLSKGASLEEIYYTDYKTHSVLDYKSHTALRYAVNVEKPNLEIIKYLIKKGADVNYESRYTDENDLKWIRTPITEIIERASYSTPSRLSREEWIEEEKNLRKVGFEIVKLLHESGASIKDREGYYPFFRAIKANNLEIIEYLYQKENYDLTQVDVDGKSYVDLTEEKLYSIKFLLNRVDEKMAKKLLINIIKGCKNPDKGRNQEESVYEAALKDKNLYIELLKEFLEKFDNPFSGKEKNISLVKAIDIGEEDVVKILLEKYQFDLDNADYDGETLLSKAIDNYKIFEFLVKYGADVNLLDKDKKSILFYVVENFRASLVKILLNYKADYRMKNSEGKTVLEVLEDEFEKIIDEEEKKKKNYSYEEIKKYITNAEKFNSNVFEFIVDTTDKQSIESTLNQIVEMTADTAKFKEIAKKGEIYSFDWQIKDKNNSLINNFFQLSYDNGFKEKIVLIIKNIISSGEVILKNPVSILGFDEVILLAMANEKNLSLLKEFLEYIHTIDNLDYFYKHTDKLLNVVKQYLNKEVFVIYSTAYKLYNGLIPSYDLLDMLGGTGENYELFFSIFKEINSEEDYQDELDDYTWLYEYRLKRKKLKR